MSKGFVMTSLDFYIFFVFSEVYGLQVMQSAETLQVVMVVYPSKSSLKEKRWYTLRLL